MLNDLMNLIWDSGLFYIDWRMITMWGVVGVLFYLAVKHQFEPLLLIPIAFGALLANLPTNGVVNKPAGEIIAPDNGTVAAVFAKEGQKLDLPRVLKDQPDAFWRIVKLNDNGEPVNAQKDIQSFLDNVQSATKTEFSSDLDKAETKAKGVPNLLAIVRPSEKSDFAWRDSIVTVKFNGSDIAVRPSDELVWANSSGTVIDVNVAAGQSVLKGQPLMKAYAAHTGGLYYYIQWGVLLELFPPIIFLGVGALTDFGPLIANPKTLLLGAAAQFGVFFTMFGAICLGFNCMEAASIGIIGGADGPTSIFLSNKLAPHLMAPIAVAAYSYMALVPIIQPPIMRLLTTKAERKIRMKSLRKVSRLEKLVFAIIVSAFCIILIPDASALIGMLMLGNFLRESGVCERLNKAAQNEIINIVTIFLGTSVGITMTGDKFLRAETLSILFLGVVAFMISTAAGVLMAKVMNLFSKDKINPLIGSAGVSAVPMAARVSHIEGQKADPSNFLLMHAMGPNVAGVIGTAVVAGFFIATLM